MQGGSVSMLGRWQQVKCFDGAPGVDGCIAVAGSIVIALCQGGSCSVSRILWVLVHAAPSLVKP